MFSLPAAVTRPRLSAPSRCWYEVLRGSRARPRTGGSTPWGPPVDFSHDVPGLLGHGSRRREILSFLWTRARGPQRGATRRDGAVRGSGRVHDALRDP